MTVEARTLRRGADHALAAVQRALDGLGVDAALTGAEILDSATFGARADRPAVPDLVTTADIGRMLGVSRARAGQLAATPGFPAPAVRLSSGPLWIRQHIDRWASTWNRRPGPKPPG